MLMRSLTEENSLFEESSCFLSRRRVPSEDLTILLSTGSKFVPTLQGTLQYLGAKLQVRFTTPRTAAAATVPRAPLKYARRAPPPPISHAPRHPALTT